jgi:hypothetical protein
MAGDMQKRREAMEAEALRVLMQEEIELVAGGGGYVEMKKPEHKPHHMHEKKPEKKPPYY